MSIQHTQSGNSPSQEALGHLQQLVQVNLDSAAGFREAADAVADKSLASDFRVWAADRTRHADELGKLVSRHDQKVPEHESWLASLHQTWLKLRAAITSGDSYAVLVEAERGEDQIKDKYEEVLQETPGTAVNDVIQRQYATVKSVHDRVRDLRDARQPQ